MLICVFLLYSSVIQILLPSFVFCKLQQQLDVLADIAQNHGKIANIFRQVSTLNILLKNYEQPEGMLHSLRNIFKFGEQSFVVFNFESEKSHGQWLKYCKKFKDEPKVRIAYYERLYKKLYEPLTVKLSLTSGEEKSEDFIDSQGSIPFQSDEGNYSLPESVANSFDNWFSFRNAGFILICPYNVLDIYLGCVISRSGTYLFIIDSKEHPSLNELCNVLNSSWKSSTNSKLFVLFFNEIYILNPFKINEKTQTFGILEKLSSDKEIKRDFKNLNRYPMSVDLFESAYSIISKKQNFSGRLESFRGPDVKVAEFIEEQMNVSSN